MQFSRVLPLLITEFKKQKIDFALIGGLALYFLGNNRTTFDADFMIFLTDADKVDAIMKKLGYDVLKRSQDVGNYHSTDPEMGQVDFIFAHRQYASAMLKRAIPETLLHYPVKILKPEDLIGLKIQASNNDPTRWLKDQLDIESILQNKRFKLDWQLIEMYYTLFKKEKEFMALKKKYK